MQGKNGINQQKAGYVKLPVRILELGLSVQAIAIYCFLIRHTENFNAPMSVIADRMKLSKKSVRKYIKELESHNVIEKAGFKNFQLYRLLSPKGWI